MPKICLLRLQLLSFIALCYSQKILLYDTTQTESTTNCDQGLLHGIDLVSFRAIVSFEGASKDWGKNIIFELKADKHSENHTVFLKNCDDEFNSAVCNCKTKGIDSYEIECSIRANVNFSQAELRGKLTNINGHSIYSEIRILPKIFDIAAVEIEANGVKVTQSNCNIGMIPTAPALRVCCKKAPFPCKVSIYTLGNHLATKEECVYVERVEFPDSITIEYLVCGLRYDMQCRPNFVYITTNNYDDSTGDSGLSTEVKISVIAVIVSFVVVLVIAVLILMCRKKLKERLCNEQINLPAARVMYSGVSTSSLEPQIQS